MAVAKRKARKTARKSSAPAGPRAADVFVIFGITGDLAKVMTFNSLYRLEARGLLDCPIVGVAFDDWSEKDLREHARKAIETSSGSKPDPKIFNRLAKRFSYVQGDFSEDATYERVGKAIKGAKTPVFYLEIPPSLFGMTIGGLSKAGLTENARVVVEKPFGHDLESARELADEIHQYIREDQLYRIDHFLGLMGLGRDPLPALRQRDLRARLEPQQHRLRADHDGRGLRRLGSRQLLRPGRRRPRRRGQPPDADRRGLRDGAARRPGRTIAEGRHVRGLLGDAEGRSEAVRARAVRGLPEGSRGWPRARAPRRSRRCASRSTTGAGPGCPSSSGRGRNSRWSSGSSG